MGRLRLVFGGLLACSAGLFTAVACTTPEVTQAPLPTQQQNNNNNNNNTGDDDTTTNPGSVTPESDPPLPDGGKPPGRVYAHTRDTLYLYDPLVKKLTVVAPFGGLQQGVQADGTADRVLDIALDKDSVMYGTTDTGFIKIDPVTAKVTYIHQEGNFEYPNALTFVPTGTVDPTKEALVGFKQLDGQTGATSYVRIDLTSGAITTIGDINGATTFGAFQWQSSGDIIAMSRDGNRAFVTVKLWNPDGGTVDGDPGTDSLAEIDPAKGTIKNIIGDIGQPNLYGLGQWAGTAYGFNAAGNIIQIDLTTGAGTTLTTLTDDAGVAGSWFGAGVTTNSPTKP